MVVSKNQSRYKAVSHFPFYSFVGCLYDTTTTTTTTTTVGLHTVHVTGSLQIVTVNYASFAIWSFFFFNFLLRTLGCIFGWWGFLIKYLIYYNKATANALQQLRVYLLTLIPFTSSSSKEPMSKASAAFTSPLGGINGGGYWERERIRFLVRKHVNDCAPTNTYHPVASWLVPSCGYKQQNFVFQYTQLNELTQKWILGPWSGIRNSLFGCKHCTLTTRRTFKSSTSFQSVSLKNGCSFTSSALDTNKEKLSVRQVQMSNWQDITWSPKGVCVCVCVCVCRCQTLWEY